MKIFSNLSVVNTSLYSQNKNIKKNLHSMNTLKADVVSFSANFSERNTKLGIDINKYTKIVPLNKMPLSDDAVSLTFFGVEKIGNPDANIFHRRAKAINDLFKTKKEINYIELAKIYGDKETALRIMGLGHLLGEWKVQSPDTMFPELPLDAAIAMAQHGLVTITKE